MVEDTLTSPHCGRAKPLSNTGEFNPSLPILCLLVFLAVLPVTLLVPILKPLVLDRFPVGPFAAHSFLSINMIGAILAAPAVGWFVDRIGRRQPIVVGAFFLDALLLLAMNWAPNYAVLMTIRFLEGVTHIAALTGVMGAALTLAHRNSRHSAAVMGAVGASIIFAVASGAGLGGVLSKGGIVRPLIGAMIIGMIGAVISGWFLRHDRGEQAPNRGRTLPDLIRIVYSERALLIPCIFTFADRLMVGIIVSSFALYLGQVLDRPPSHIGLLMSLLLFPFALLCYPFGKLCRSWSKSFLIVIGSVLYALLVAAIGWIPADKLAWFMLLLGVVSAMNFSPSLAIVADLTGPEIRSTAMGAFNSAGSLGFFVGPLLGGTIVQATLAGGNTPALAYSLAFVAAGGVSLLITILVTPFLIRLVREGRTT